jgi:hypothetical protein
VRIVGFSNTSSGLCFLADSILVSWTSPGPPDRLTLQYQATCSQATLKQGIRNTSCQYWYCWIQRIPKEMLKDVMTAFLRDCRSLLSDSSVTYRLSYRKIMTEINSHGHGVHLKMLKKFSIIVKPTRCISVFNLLWVNSLYMCRALLAQLKEQLQKWQLVYCVRVMTVGCYQDWSGTGILILIHTAFG